MLIGTIRSTETVVHQVDAETLEELRTELDSWVGRHPGYVLSDMRISSPKETGLLRADAAARTTKTRTIEADTMDALRAAVPEGHQLLYVLSR